MDGRAVIAVTCTCGTAAVRWAGASEASKFRRGVKVPPLARTRPPSIRSGRLRRAPQKHESVPWPRLALQRRHASPLRSAPLSDARPQRTQRRAHLHQHQPVLTYISAPLTSCSLARSPNPLSQPSPGQTQEGLRGDEAQDPSAPLPSPPFGPGERRQAERPAVTCTDLLYSAQLQ